MRKIIFLLMLLISILAKSQIDTTFKYFNRKKNNISIQLSGSVLEETIINNFSLRYGRFLFNKTNIGLDIGYSFYGYYEETYYWGPYLRYYVFDKKLTHFIEVNYNRGRISYSNSITASEWEGRSNSIFVGGGIAYTGILKRIGIELYAGYLYYQIIIPDHPALGRYENAKNDACYGLRINYHF